MFIFSFHDLLTHNLADRGAATAVIDRNDRISYQELNARVEALATWLISSGVRRGDRVGIHLRKSIEEIVATFAIARVGGVFVNINAQWKLPQIDYVLRDCGIRVLITDARPARQIVESGLLKRLDRLVVKGKGPADSKLTSWEEASATTSTIDRRVINTELAALLYTSGSTGRPKGVMLSHLNLIEGARSVASYLGNTSADRVLSLLPFSFDYGLSQLTTMFLVGGSLALQPTFMPSEIVRTLIMHDVSGLPAVPPTWIELAHYLRKTPAEFPALRYLTNTGGKIPDNVLKVLPDLFGRADIYLMYGLTEAFRSTFLPPAMFDNKRGSIGRAIPNAEIFVVDHAKGICGPGEQGELLHAGSLVSQGYWGDPVATADKIRVCPHLKAILGEQKVVYSGDLVRVDEDGYFWFISRLDSMIKCSGFRISPTEVEEAISASHLVGDVVAFGVEDTALGQAVEVAVMPLRSNAFELDALKRHCQETMPAYMVPRVFHVWEKPMPRTSSGKLDRPAVIETCAGK
tara:strand:- start:504 stop:2060 length:1557 start_codon:yes stop_codon:yes gene_type:complete